MLATALALSGALSALAGTHPGQTPALQVAVVKNGAVAFDRTYGVAPDTRFPIGSVTKMFTAVSIMQLVEAKKVDLDAKVATYLPDAPYASQITVRELLAHRSGLWNYGDEAFEKGWISKPTTPAAILALVAKHPLTFAPGTNWAYSNSGYVVLGQIVERVTGEPLARYERERIYAPAGMTATTMGFPARAAVAKGYMAAGGALASPWHASWFYACGDIVSTAADLARFDLALMNGKLVSKQTFAEMQRIETGTALGGDGLGLFSNPYRSLTLVGHHGGVPGYLSDNEMIPATTSAVVVLSDAFTFSTSKALNVALDREFSPKMHVDANGRAVLSRFTAALDGLIEGKVDTTQYVPAAASMLTPAVIAGASMQLQALGSVKHASLRGVQRTPQGTLYLVRATFTNGSSSMWHFVLDPSGKIASLTLAG